MTRYTPGPWHYRYFNLMGWYVIKVTGSILLAVIAIIVIPTAIYLLMP